jgi:HK97 family phage prohead protease
MSKEPLTVERRTLRLPVEIRGTSGPARTIGGYAAVFGTPSENLGGFIERVDYRAMNKSRGDGWPGVVARFNHRDEYILGATHSGTLRLAVDNYGLGYEVDLPESRNDVLESVTRGDIANSSFAFQCVDDDWSYANDVALRTLLSVRLIDVAPVVTPAYPDATVGLRSLAAHMDAPLGDVTEMAAQGELRRLFKRTDHRDHAPARRASQSLQRLLEIHAKRWPDPEPKTTPKTGHQALAETLGKRW